MPNLKNIVFWEKFLNDLDSDYKSWFKKEAGYLKQNIQKMQLFWKLVVVMEGV